MRDLTHFIGGRRQLVRLQVEEQLQPVLGFSEEAVGLGQRVGFVRAEAAGDFEGFERNVDVHVTSLRRKLEASGTRFIKTVYGLGYKLEVQAPART